MGIHDRDYYQPPRGGGTGLRQITSTAVGTLILVNVVVWVLQLATDPLVTDALSASAGDVFGRFQIWRVVTANFVHATGLIWHVAMNMLVLFWAGREIERVYGTRDFTILYFAAGIFAILLEIGILQARGATHVPVIGASGAVMAVFVIFAILFPQRRVLLFFFLPVPVWILCVVFILYDLQSGLTGSGAGVANFAHLGGAAVGALYWKLDLRWSRVRGLFGRGRSGRAPRKAKRRRAAKVVAFPHAPRDAVRDPADEAPSQPSPEVTAISERIDQLLSKISSEGQASLSEEELEFLKQNSGRYRSS